MGTQKITMTLVLALDDTSLQIKRKIVMPVNLPPGTYQATVEVEPFGVEITAGSHVVGHRLSMEPVMTPITAEQFYKKVPEVDQTGLIIPMPPEERARHEAARPPVQTPNKVGEACETTSANPPARKRKKRGVVLETPSQVKEQENLTLPVAEKSANADTIEKSPNADTKPVIVDPPAAVPKEGTTVPETVTDEEAPPSGMVAKPVPVDHDKMERVFAGKPTAEEEKEFKARLSKYVLTPDGILEKAGMRPMEGFGGVHKQIRLYVNKMYPEVDDLKKLTATQWSAFLSTLDSYMTEGGEGAKALIEMIHKTIGAAA